MINPAGKGIHRPGRGARRGNQLGLRSGIYWPAEHEGPCLWGQGVAQVAQRCECCLRGLFVGHHTHPDGSRGQVSAREGIEYPHQLTDGQATK